MKIVAVDASDPATAALLQYLQLQILPHDIPQDVHVGYWWVAYDKDLPVAFALLMPSVQWSDTGYLSRSGVLSSYRGKGLQKRLVRVRERKAKKLGWKWLISDTNLNPPSSNNLITCGYRIFQPSSPWGFETAIYWRKALS
jgi:GNAT superfamily N-acetyltransferase